MKKIDTKKGRWTSDIVCLLRCGLEKDMPSPKGHSDSESVMWMESGGNIKEKAKNVYLKVNFKIIFKLCLKLKTYIFSEIFWWFLKMCFPNCVCSKRHRKAEEVPWTRETRQLESWILLRGKDAVKCIPAGELRIGWLVVRWKGYNNVKSGEVGDCTCLWRECHSHEMHSEELRVMSMIYVIYFQVVYNNPI